MVPKRRLAAGAIAAVTVVHVANADCPADLDASGDVGAPDLMQLILNWGECAGCKADISADGMVDGVDLVSLLLDWGPCAFVWPDTCVVDDVMTIDISNSLGSVSLVYTQQEGEWINDQWYVWCLTGDCSSPFPPSTSIELGDPDTGNIVATLQFAKVEIIARHKVALEIKLIAGADDTLVSVRGPIAGFASVDAAIAEGRATASVALSDYNCDGWSSIEGDGPPGTGIALPFYNAVNGDAPLFTQLIGNAGTNNCWPWFGTGSSQDPSLGHRPVGGTISDAGVDVRFVLSEGDWANVSADFEVVPDLEGTCGQD